MVRRILYFRVMNETRPATEEFCISLLDTAISTLSSELIVINQFHFIPIENNHVEHVEMTSKILLIFS